MVQTLLSLAVLSLFCGCSNAAAAPPENPARAESQSLSTPGSVAPYVFGGEQLVGKVAVLGIDAADATVRVEGGCGTELAPMRIRTRGRTTGLFALFANSWLEVDSTIAAGIGMPDSGRSEIKIGSVHRKYTVKYAPGSYRYDYVRNGDRVRKERVPLPDGLRAHDVHSAVLYLRAWRPLPESRNEMLVVMGRHLWRLELLYKGPDVVAASSGPRPAVRIEALATKLSKASDKQTRRKLFIWFSDDEARMPLRALAESEFGPVELTLTSYSCPGCNRLCPPALRSR